jgi:hypothetical protein
LDGRIDFVRDAGCKLPDRLKFLRLAQVALHPLSLRNVFLHGKKVRWLAILIFNGADDR